MLFSNKVTKGAIRTARVFLTGPLANAEIAVSLLVEMDYMVKVRLVFEFADKAPWPVPCTGVRSGDGVNHSDSFHRDQELEQVRGVSI